MKKLMLLNVILALSFCGLHAEDAAEAKPETITIRPDTAVSDVFFLGSIGNEERVYLEIPLANAGEINSLGERIKDFNKKIMPALGSRVQWMKEIDLGDAVLGKYIVLPKPEVVNIYSSRGYEGQHFTKDYVVVRNEGTQEWYPFIKTDKSIPNVPAFEYYSYYNKPVIAIPAVLEDNTVKELSIIRKNDDPAVRTEILGMIRESSVKNLQKLTQAKTDKERNYIPLSVVKSEIQNLRNSRSREWEIAVFEGDIDADKDIEQVCDATWRNENADMCISSVFAVDTENLMKQIKYIVPMKLTSDANMEYWKVAYGIDIEGDGYHEMLIFSFSFEGSSLSVYKRGLDWYKEVYRSYYFGG